MKSKLGEEWYNLLYSYLYTKEFKNLKNTLNGYYEEGKSIIPEKHSPLYFKIFRDLPPSKIKVVIFGQDPYPQKDIYTGYAFDNANSKSLSASLRNILKEVSRSFPDNYLDLRFGNIDLWDLSRWVRQGVFLINTALSVEEGKPGSHLDLWKPFTIEWISRLCHDKDELIWLLWGSQAHNYAKYIHNSTHFVIKTGHPSPLNSKNPFVGCNCFTECNQELVGRNKSEILW